MNGYGRFEPSSLHHGDLLDLSHESFVHEETIGNEAVAEAPCTVTLHGNISAFTWVVFDIEAPPFYRRTTGFTGRINRWHTNHFTPP